MGGDLWRSIGHVIILLFLHLAFPLLSRFCLMRRSRNADLSCFQHFLWLAYCGKCGLQFLPQFDLAQDLTVFDRWLRSIGLIIEHCYIHNFAV